MSRLPVISTPGRLGTPPTTGIPTPTHRRPRSSLGPNQGNHVKQQHDDPAMDQALQEVLRQRPPSSIRQNRDGDDNDPDTPTQPAFLKSVPGLAASGLAAPRTPGVRARTPIGVGQAPVTPSAISRSVSGRPSMSARPSIGGASASSSGTGTFTPRRPSMASSVASTTPYATRRSESRMSSAHTDVGNTKWQPIVGERVRASGMGMEGTLKFMGETEFKAGIWAGIELEGGFSGKGKNDGSVAGIQYFSCPPNCGIFVLASKLSAPTSGPSISRPESVASSYRSHTSLSVHHPPTAGSGRQTPSIDRFARPVTTTPGRATRSVSTLVRGATTTPRASMAGNHTIDRDQPLPDDGNRPVKTLLGNSTSSNAAIAASKITAGSRASKYLGMTAKQLESARSGTLTASVRGATNLATPRAPSRVSMGQSTTTPSRNGPRPSIGGVTPRARPRPSNALSSFGGGDTMPPPPSPSKISQAMKNHQAQLEEEIRELRAKNAELEEELSQAAALASESIASQERQLQLQEDAEAAGAGDLQELRKELLEVQRERDDAKHQLASAQMDATSATDMATELAASELQVKADLANKEKELESLRKEMRLGEERAAGELEAGMEAKKREIQDMRLQLEEAQRGWSDQSALVEELSAAGTAAISLYEGKVSAAEMQRDELEDRVRHLEDKLRKATEEKSKLETLLEEGSTAKSSSSGGNYEQTAAEIDNETLNAQVKHLQNRINHMEEALEDARVQLDNDNDAWKARLTKSKDAERILQEQLKEGKSEGMRLHKDIGSAKARIGELEVALKENQGALEGARAEIESLRVDAAEASSLRTALQKANEMEKTLESKTKEIADLRERLKKLSQAEQDLATYHDQVKTLEAEVASLQRKSPMLNSLGLPMPHSPDPSGTPRKKASLDVEDAINSTTSGSRRPRLSTGSQEADETKMRGYHYLIKELSEENSQYKEKQKLLEEEIGLLKEEIKLLEETNEAAAGGAVGPSTGAPSKELLEAKAKVQEQAQIIKDLEREVSELESLIESKIYQQDDLENRIAELEKDLLRAKANFAKASAVGPQSATISNHQRRGSPSPTRSGTRSRTTSTSGSMHTAEEDQNDDPSSGTERCELCEGPHDLDACPVFAGNLDAMGDMPRGGSKGIHGMWCADCESAEHDTADCPMAEEVF